MFWTRGTVAAAVCAALVLISGSADLDLQNVLAQETRSPAATPDFGPPETIVFLDNRNGVLNGSTTYDSKDVGILWDGAARVATVAHNNTFVNCGVDISAWTNPPINVYNNLYYHSCTF